MEKFKPDKTLTWKGDLTINPTTSQGLLLVSEGGEGVSFLYEHGPWKVNKGTVKGQKSKKKFSEIFGYADKSMPIAILLGQYHSPQIFALLCSFLFSSQNEMETA